MNEIKRMTNTIELNNYVNSQFPDMTMFESYEEYLERKIDDLTQTEIKILKIAIEKWFELEK